jgi:hypothetical protein
MFCIILKRRYLIVFKFITLLILVIAFIIVIFLIIVDSHNGLKYGKLTYDYQSIDLYRYENPLFFFFILIGRVVLILGTIYFSYLLF